jgi:hypothetical protein
VYGGLLPTELKTKKENEMNTQPVENKVNAWGAAFRTFLLFFCVLFSLRFLILLFHEGGHALPDLIAGTIPRILYAHPFSFGGLVYTTVVDVISAAAGPVMMVLVPLLLFILLWKHRSVALLPLVMAFPWAAMEAGMDGFTIRQMGDYPSIIHITGLPEAVIVIPCLVLFVIGGFFFLLLMPLLGLGPKNWRVLLALPAAVLLWTGVSIVVASLVFPGSPVESVIPEEMSMIQAGSGIGPVDVLLMLLVGVLYLTLYRWISPRLPSWLRSETVALTWKDLRIPALLAVVSVLLGLLIIT